jgi:hypothetical protein
MTVTTVPSAKHYLDDATEADYDFWIVPDELRIFARPKTETQPPHPAAVRFCVDQSGAVHMAANQ